MVIATIGEVDSGAIDPLADIADIAAKYDMWFHVDAAYGGFFLMCDNIKERARGESCYLFCCYCSFSWGCALLGGNNIQPANFQCNS